MPTMESVSNEVHFNLFTGEPGMRKSTAALSYPKPQFWLSWDKKMNALMIPMKKWNIDSKQISYEDYSDWDKARFKLEALTMNCPYKTIVGDSLTTAVDACLRQTLKSKVGKINKAGGAAGKQIGGIPVTDVEDFNAEAAMINEFVALLKDIKNNHGTEIIIIAHVVRTEQKALDGSVNVSRVLVTAGKKPAAKLPAYCDEIYSFSQDKSMDPTKEGDYLIHTQWNGEDFARTTLPLPAKIIVGNNPLYDTVIKPAIDQQREGGK